MTLRMTLTRPDLRADDSVLYPDAISHPAVVVRRSDTMKREKMGKGFGGPEKDGKDPLWLDNLKADPVDMSAKGKKTKEVSGVRRFWRRW